MSNSLYHPRLLLKLVYVNAGAMGRTSECAIRAADQRFQGMPQPIGELMYCFVQVLAIIKFSVRTTLGFGNFRVRISITVYAYTRIEYGGHVSEKMIPSVNESGVLHYTLSIRHQR